MVSFFLITSRMFDGFVSLLLRYEDLPPYPFFSNDNLTLRLRLRYRMASWIGTVRVVIVSEAPGANGQGGGARGGEAAVASSAQVWLGRALAERNDLTLYF